MAPARGGPSMPAPTSTAAARTQRPLALMRLEDRIEPATLAVTGTVLVITLDPGVTDAALSGSGDGLTFDAGAGRTVAVNDEAAAYGFVGGGQTTTGSRTIPTPLTDVRVVGADGAERFTVRPLGNALPALDVADSVETTVLAAEVNSAGGQFYHGAVELAGNVGLIAGQVSFGGAVAVGGGVLSVAADEIDFGGPVGGNGILNLQTRAPGQNVELGGSGDTPALDLTAAEIARIGDGFGLINIVTVPGTGGVVVAGPVAFTDPVSLRTLGADGFISVAGTLTGTGDAALTLVGRTTLAANVVTAGTPITVNGDVTLGPAAAVTLDTTAGGAVAQGADISLGRVDDDAAGTTSLTLNGGAVGAVAVTGAVGATTRPAGLTVSGASALFTQPVLTAGGQAVTADEIRPAATHSAGGPLALTGGVGLSG